MRATITTTADCDLLEKADKLGISRTQAVDRGLRQLIAEHEDYVVSVESLQDNISNLQRLIREKCERIEELELVQ